MILFKLKSRLYISIIIFLIIGCNDIWNGSEKEVVKNLYLIYTNGNGIMLTIKKDGNNYENIFNTSINALYMNKDFLIIKIDSSYNNSIYYKLNHSNFEATGKIDTIELKEYDSLKKVSINQIDSSRVYR